MKIKFYVYLLPFTFYFLPFLQAQQPCDVWYVSSSGSGTLGTSSAPVTLTYALANITPTRNFLKMLGGSYALAGKLQLSSNITLEGGYQISGTDWVLSSSVPTTLNITPSLETAVVGGITVGHYIGVEAMSISNFILRNLTINVLMGGASGSTSNRGHSIYGIYVNSCSSYEFSRLSVNTGSASGGDAGTAIGGTGGAGGGGSGGSAGTGSGSGCGCSSGSGGIGGGGNGGASGGGGGAGCCGSGCNWYGCNANGCNASSGSAGNAGGNGATFAPGNKPAANAATNTYYLPNGQSSLGGNGFGGGGGGGGGGGDIGTCCACGCGSGSTAGGAGGSGGGGGLGGNGAYGGGGTFGIYATGAGSGTVLDCFLNPGTGGAGGTGSGGQGGAGGNAGAGGSCHGGCEGGCGGNGAQGGAGGNGGRGRDGADGPSTTLVQNSGATATQTGVTIPSTYSPVTNNQNRGCTNSEIILTKNSGNFDMAGMGNPSFINNLNSTTTSYTTASSPAIVYFTTTGLRDAAVSGEHYEAFINIVNSRTLPSISMMQGGSPVSVICPNTVLDLSTSAGSTNYDWTIVSGVTPSAPSGGNGSATTSHTFTSGGTYQIKLRVYDDCCNWSIPIYSTITVSPAPAAATAGNKTLCNGQNVQIGAAPVGGNTYNWSPATDLDDATISNPTSNASSTITYTLTETITATGCQASNSVTVTVNPLPAANAGNNQSICSGQSIAIGNPPVGGNTYSWTPTTDLSSSTVSNPNANPTSNTTYTLTETVTATGCQNSNSATVTVNPLPVADAGTNQTICENSNVQIGAPPVAGNTYNWIPSTGLSLASASDPTASPTTTTTYSLTETITATGCQKSNSITVNVNPAPAANAGSNQTICNGQSVQIGAASVGGDTYIWSPGNNLNDSTISNPTSNPSNTITYSLTETITATGCQKSNPVTITVNQLPVVGYSGLASAYCIDASTASLNGFPSGGTFAGTGISGTSFDPASAGVGGPYNITYVYTDGNSCTDSSIQTTTVNNLPVVNFTGLSGPYCASITSGIPLTGNPGGGTYSGTGISGNSFFPNIANVGNNVIVYDYTDGNNCANSYTDSVTVIGVPFASFSGLGGPYCVSDSTPVSLTGTPSGGTFIGNGISGNVFTPSVAGAGNQTITYTYTDGNGCTNSQNQSATVNALPAVTFSGLDTAYCVNASDVSLTGFPSGGTFSGTAISGNTFSPAGAGTGGPYTITYSYTGGNGCADSTNKSVVVYTAPTVSFTGLAATYCVNANADTLTGTPSGGTFSGNGISGNNFYPSIADTGAHTITYTYADANKCSNFQTQNVTVFSIPVVSFSGLSGPYCSNAAPVTLTGNPSGGTFSGNGVSGNSFDPSVAGAGTYSIKYFYSDANGCSDSTSQSVTVEAAPTVDFAVLDTVYCDNASSVNLTGFPAGGTFSGNGISGNVFSPSAAGAGTQTITYTYTDGNSCTSTISKNTNVNTAPSPVITASGPVTFCMGDSVLLTATAAAAYQWSTGASLQTITVSASGNYVVTVTDAGGCSAMASTTVTANSNPSLSASSVTNASCNGANDGSATVSASGGAFPYSYQWDSNAGNQTSPTATGLNAGTYSITVSDANTCSSSLSVTVNNPSGLTALTNSSNSCTGGSTGTATASGTGGTSPYNFQWDNSTGNQTTATATGLAAGTYSVTVTDANACTFLTSAVVSASTVVFVSSSTSPACVGGNTGSATANPGGGTSPYTYLWSNSATSVSLSGLPAGAYSVTVTDNQSCTGTSNITVGAVNAIATSTASASTCTGGSTGTATVSAAGGTIPYSYLWDSNAGNQISPTATGLSAGNYSVTVSDANSCSAVASVNVGSVAGVSLSTSSNGGCGGGNAGSATAAGSGGTLPYSYQWDVNAGNQTSATATGLATGTYNVTVSDFNGCSSAAAVNVNVTSALNLSAASTDAQCSGGTTGTATAVPSGGTSPYTFSWSNGATSVSLSGLPAGTYTVTVTDSNSCTGTAQAVINQPVPVSVTTSSTSASCGMNDGSATAGAAGGTIPYSYQWDSNAGNQISATATGLGVGIYAVTVTDGNGCTKSSSVIVNGTSSLSLGITSTNATCNGANNGTAVVVANGGTTPYTYLWNNGQTNSTATGLAIGNYSVTVTNADGCSAVDTVSVSQPPPIATSISNDTTTCSGDTITLTVSGGASYLWTSGQNTSTITVAPVSNSIYSVGVFDNTGCMVTASVTVTVIPDVVASISGNLNICLGKSAILDAGGGTNYLWSTGENTQSITVSPAVSSTYFVTSSNSCFSDSSSALVTVSYITVTASSDTTILIGASAQLNATGGILYLWEPPQNLNCSNCPNPVASPTATTMYMVTVTDAGGCAGKDTVNINVDDSKAVFVPNIFSPNGDGQNDALYVFGKGITSMQLLIYDRWGQVVFQSAKQSKGWNGTSTDGTLLNTGVFVYYLTVEFYDGATERLQGNITLVK